MRLILVIPFLWLALASLRSMAQTQSEPRIILGPIAKAPAETRSWKNPYEGQPEAVQAGEKLFRQHCSECHGEDARGIGKAVDLRSSPVQNATPGELVWFLRNGNLAHGMPSWSGLPIQRRWQLVTYLKTLKNSP
jgi:mono/diheme cytochrome c family protein